MNELSNISRYDRLTHRPCFFLAMAMALGICLGRTLQAGWSSWSLLCGISLILSLGRHRLTTVFLYLSLVFLGAFYYQSIRLLPADHIHFLSYRQKKDLNAVEGIVDSDVQTKLAMFGTKQVFELEASRVKIESRWQPASGRILVQSFKRFDYHYGDELRLEGTLFKVFQNPLSKFSYQKYLEDHGLYLNFSVGRSKSIEVLSRHHTNWLIALSFKMKHKFKKVLSSYLEPLEASMIQAMVLGDRSLMTKDVYAIFSKTGTSHILAISGMNMTMISAIVLFLLKTLRLSRRIQFILTGIFLLFYALITGWSASVVRSVLMAVVLLSSFCLEQETDTANSLGLAAIILFLLNPMSLFDIGFQLSFICVLILVFFHPLFHVLIEKYITAKWTKYVAQAASVSLIAWIGACPIVAYEFDIVSPIAVLANIPIVPLADLTIALSLGVAVLGTFCPPLAWAFAGSLKAVFNSLLIVTSWFAQIPGGYFYVHEVPLLAVFLSYFILLMVYLLILYGVKLKVK